MAGGILGAIWAALTWKCPRCHSGEVFKSSMMNGVYNMHDNCPKCNQDLQVEPGFYWGAMYVGYGLSSGYLLAGLGICLLWLKLSLGASFGVLIASLIIMIPLIARTSRTIWLIIWVRYNPNAIAQRNEELQLSNHKKE